MKEQQVRFGCRIFLGSKEPFSQVVQRARFCEKYGFNSVIIDDHVLYGTSLAAAPEPFATLAAITLQTRKIMAGVAVTDMVRRHPAILAQTIATLSSMGPRRVFFGLGAGDPMNQAPIGLPTQNRFNKLKEGLKMMRMLWASSVEKPVTYKGRFFSFNRAYLQMGMEKTPARVYLAAFGEKMLRLAGEEADGWIPHCHTPSTYRADLLKIQAGARRVGRNLGPFDPCYYTLAAASPREQPAIKRVLGPAKYFLALIPEGLRKVDPNVQHPGRIWEKQADPRQQRKTIRKIASSIPNETALKVAIHGTPSQCIEQIAQYRKAGCRHFMLEFVPKGGLWSTRGLLPSIRFFSERVISTFRNQ